MQALLQNYPFLPTAAPHTSDSKRLHEFETREVCTKTVLSSCYWVQKALVNTEILRPRPEVSSLAPKSACAPLDLLVPHPTNAAYVGVPKFYGMSAFGPAEKDTRVDGLPIKTEWNESYQLRPEQAIAVSNAQQSVAKWGGAFVIADCGFGKTILISRLIHETGKKAMVVVPRLTLVEQLANDLGRGTTRPPVVKSSSVGIIQGSWEKTCGESGKDILVASLDSLSLFRYPSEFWKSIGLIIFDEAHHMAARTLSQILPYMHSRRIVGFSATPDRKDGLEHVLYWLLGPPCFIYQRLPSVTGLRNTLVVKSIPGIECQDRFMWGGKLNFAEMINDLAASTERNDMILKAGINLLGTRKKILFITALRDHVDALATALMSETGERVKIIHGGKKRKVDEEGARILVATYGMLEEGFDDPELDTLILCTPRSRVQQTVGRIERVMAGKLVPLVLDVVDQHQVFNAMWYKRRQFYSSRGFKIESAEKEEATFQMGSEYEVDDD